MAKGKKLTCTQRNILMDHGIKDTENYRYSKTITKNSEGGRAARRNGINETYMEFINTETNETIQLRIL